MPWVGLGLFLCGPVMQQKISGCPWAPQVLLPVNTLRIKSFFSISDEKQLLSIHNILPSLLGECVWLWSRQQRTLAPLLGEQRFRWGFPEDRRPWRGFWVQYNFDSCLHWKNKILQGQMTLATGTSGSCNFQHAAEQSSVQVIWAPARFECVDLHWWVWSISRRSARLRFPSCTWFPILG